MGNSNRIYFPSIPLTFLVENPRVSLFKSAITRMVELKRRFKKRKLVLEAEVSNSKIYTSWNNRSSWNLGSKNNIKAFGFKSRKQSRTISKVRHYEIDLRKSQHRKFPEFRKRKAYLPVSGLLSLLSVLDVHRYLLIVLSCWIKRVKNKPFIWQWNAG